MTDYQTWIARGTAVCDAECAEAMGWDNAPGGYWLTKEQWPCDWPETDEPGRKRFLSVSRWSPTTDRNATEMMVKEVGLRGRQSAFLDAAAIRDAEGVKSGPPKPTPPPLREFREGDIPKKVKT
jgi:hypothetical protein